MTTLDADLLSRLHRRDAETLREVIRDNTRPLYRAARALGFSEPEAEDLAQSTLVTFLETIQRFEGRSRIRTWLFGILHRKVLERRREQQRETHHDPIDEVFESRFDSRGGWTQPPKDLDRLLQSKEIGEAITSCLDTLPVRQRSTFVLREIEQLDTPEICKIQGVSATYFGVLLHRARIRLRECLESRGWGHRK
ncbi:MAG: sigma-70 family RNA polymerase sigma factor [Acidobacteriota bacterium]